MVTDEEDVYVTSISFDSLGWYSLEINGGVTLWYCSPVLAPIAPPGGEIVLEVVS